MNKPIRKMIYQSKGTNLLLASGIEQGFQYYILNLGTHPCAYIEIPREHPLFEKHYSDIDINLGVNGGITYSDNGLIVEEDEKEGWIIGWDYAHLGDYVGYQMNIPEHLQIGGKVWTTNEILLEVMKAIKLLSEVK